MIILTNLKEEKNKEQYILPWAAHSKSSSLFHFCFFAFAFNLVWFLLFSSHLCCSTAFGGGVLPFFCLIHTEYSWYLGLGFSSHHTNCKYFNLLPVAFDLLLTGYFHFHNSHYYINYNSSHSSAAVQNWEIIVSTSFWLAESQRDPRGLAGVKRSIWAMQWHLS